MATAAAKKRKRSDPPGISIPDDLFFNLILPCLSFKSLCIAKMVCRSWRATISEDPSFALLQSRLSSPTSVGSVCIGSFDRFVFLPTRCSPVGAAPLNLGGLRITASTNGLLCCCCRNRDDDQISISLINPATWEWVDVGRRVVQSVGLVFDPVSSPDRFTLVNLIVENTCLGYLYRFEVFLSESGEWTPSEAEMAGYPLWFDVEGDPLKSVQVRGIIYWDCTDYILWFDTGRDTVGQMRVPLRPRSWSHELGVWEGQMTLTRCSSDGIEIWATTDTCTKSLDILHMINWEALNEGENWKLFDEFFLGAKETEKNQLVGMLPFEGGERVYLKLKKSLDPNVVKVISYNFRTKVAEWFQFDGMKDLSDVKNPVFGYHNSMVAVPKVFRKEEAKHE